MYSNIYCKCCNQNIWREIKNTIGGDYLKCANCYYHMHCPKMNEVLDREFQVAQEKFYGSNSIMFSPLFESLEDESTARRIQILRKHLTKGKIIEIGPGTGRFLAAAIKVGFDVDAVEHSKTFTDEINKKFGLQIRNGKFEDQDFNEQEYDAYLSFHVIEHVPDVIAHLEKAMMIIKPGGYAIIATPNANSWEHRLASVRSPNYCSSHIHLFTKESLSLCLEHTGWEVIETFTPAYTSSWPRVLTSLLRSRKNQIQDSGGKYIQSTKRSVLLLVKIFKFLSKPFRLIQEFFKGGNELFVVAIPKIKKRVKENKKKLLIIYGELLHYRKPLFNQIANRYDLTVVHTGVSSVTKHDAFKEKLVSYRKLGPFFIQSGIKNEADGKYEYVIVFMDVRWLSRIYVVLRRNPHAKIILWGLWATKNSMANWLRVYLAKRAAANVFYTYESKCDFLSFGVTQNKLFVANNTFDVGERIKAYESDIKDLVLFVGSLDKRKQIDVLIRAFAHICNGIGSYIQLAIIGDGETKLELMALADELRISDRVIFVGRINDSLLLKKYYQRAIISVSFGQAGLSVLQSFGFGVPFLTKHNAVSGGEKSNIKNGLNGILCQDSLKSLEENILNVCSNIELAKVLGENAFEYYSKFCTIANMAQGFFDAIEGTRLANVDTDR